MDETGKNQKPAKHDEDLVRQARWVPRFVDGLPFMRHRLELPSYRDICDGSH